MSSSTDADDGMVYRELRDFFSVDPLRMRLCMLRSVTWAWIVIFHNLVHGHRNPLRTALFDTVILAVWLS